MEIIKNYYEKYKEVIRYLIFGVLTTIVNYVVYYSLIFIIGTADGAVGVICNLVATIISILFAYITNRKFVFESKAVGKNAILKEITSFFSCRIFSMIVDSLIYFVGCTIIGFNDFIIKTISQVVVIVLNYIFSKLIIFKNK